MLFQSLLTEQKTFSSSFLRQYLTNFILAASEPSPPIDHVLGRIPKCTIGLGIPNCTTIMYLPSTGAPWVNQFMDRLIVTQGLPPETVVGRGNAAFGVLGIKSDVEMVWNYTAMHPNQTMIVLQFTSAYFGDRNVMPTYPGYLLWYNYSQHYEFITAVRAVDEEIIRTKLGVNATLTEGWGHFPVVEARIAQMDVVTANGGVYFYLVPMIVFFVLLTNIVQEKEANLRTGMRLMGLSPFIYWVCWTLQALFFVLLSTLVLMGTAAACQFDVFLRTNQAVVFLMFFLYGISIVAMAFFFSAFIEKVQTAQAVGYGIILLGFIFQSILTSAYGVFVDILYSPEIPAWVVLLRILFMQYPPFNFAKIYSDVAFLSGNTIDFKQGVVKAGAGFAWNDLWHSRDLKFANTVFTIPPPYQALVVLVANTIIWGLLSWYFNNILGEGSRPWYFPFTGTYWGCCVGRLRHRHRNGGGGEEQTPPDDQQEEEALVNVSHVRKVFGSQVAVDDMSFSLLPGEIFGLLGHNGSGKSTTINMLTGLLTPTSGEISVAGIDVLRDVAAVRRRLGVCPQHDILWDDLTAAEHLRLFAQLKGMSAEAAEAEAWEKLKMVALDHVGTHLVSTYSGGMKRRLSVAISTIGDPLFLLLDEPSTGLDPVNQKQMWKLIQTLKKDRAILLTTHSMREAEVLCDRITLIAFGRICDSGTAFELKQHYGLAYEIHVQARQGAEDQIVEIVARALPGAKVLERQNSSITFQVSVEEGLDKIAPLISKLEELRASRTLVDEWGISETSLEDVFLGVTRNAGFKYQAFAETNSEHDALPSLKGGGGGNDDVSNDAAPLLAPKQHGVAVVAGDVHQPPNKPTRPRPFVALMAKNARLQSRQWGTNLCQIITPLLVLLILLVLRVVTVTQLGPTIEQRVLAPGLPFPLNASPDMWEVIYKFIGLFPGGSGLGGGLGLRWAEGGDQGAGPPSPLPPEGGGGEHWQLLNGVRPARALAEFILGLSAPQGWNIQRDLPISAQRRAAASAAASAVAFRANASEDVNNLIFFLVDAGNNSQVIGSLGQDWPHHSSPGTGLLGAIPTWQVKLRYSKTNLTQMNIPYFLPRASWQSMQEEAFHDYTILNNVTMTQVKSVPEYITLTPDAIISFHDVDYAKGNLNFSFAVSDYYILQYRRANNFTRLTTPGLNKTMRAFFLDAEDIQSYGRVQLMAMMHDAFWMRATNTSADTSNPWNWRVLVSMPQYVTADVLSLLNLVGAFLYPVALNLSLPVFLYLLVMEKQNRVKSLMQFHGMTNLSYIGSNFLFFLFMYIVIMTLFWAVGSLLKLSLFTSTAISTMLMFWMLWGLSLIAVAFFLSTFINNKSAASMVGYVVALLGPLFAILVAVGIYVVANRPMPLAWCLWPQFAFVRGIFLMTQACVQDNLCYGPLWSIDSGDEMAGILGMLALDIFIYFGAFLYLDQVLPREYGIPRHPLFFAMPLVNLCRRNSRRRSEYAELVEDVGGAQDRDVLQEAAKVDAILPEELRQRYPLVLKHLRKVYPGASRAAVKNLSLAVESSECFGLLGENGAGKSTAIAILTGLFPPTSGDGFINGHSVSTDIRAVHQDIGVCPQFSILWETLTVKEHLYFFARLKGVAFADETAHVEQALVNYGLVKEADRFAGALSGGMKRRLCVAIALVGDSKVAFLDEPSTGLDPVSKRQLWTIISNSKAGRCIVLTSHDLHETEVLCQRIGMMAFGELRALGTSLHLKNTFASGFRLIVDFRAAAVTPTELDARLRALLPRCIIEVTNAFTKSREYRLEGESSAIADAFASLSAGAQEIGISSWSMSNLGLENVFESVFHASHEEVATLN